MKTLVLLLALVGCNGCGAEEIVLDVDAELAPYLQIYLSLAPDQGHLDRLAELKFGTPPPGRGGKCFTDSLVIPEVKGAWAETAISDTRTIVIKRPKKYNARFAALVIHELGHCLHDLEHVDDPYAVMAFDRKGKNEYWEDNLALKVKQMFNQQTGEVTP